MDFPFFSKVIIGLAAIVMVCVLVEKLFKKESKAAKTAIIVGAIAIFLGVCAKEIRDNRPPEKPTTPPTTVETITTEKIITTTKPNITIEKPTTKSKTVPITELEHTTMLWPFPYENCYISSFFGSSFGSIFGSNVFSDEGIQISIADTNQDYRVVAALDGIVLGHGYDNIKGNNVWIEHGMYAPMGKRIITVYMNLKDLAPNVVVDAFIKAGSTIGTIGSDGENAESHLHFMVCEWTDDGGVSYAVDPLQYVSNPYE